MTLKGYGFATDANRRMECVPMEAPEEKDSLKGYVRPARLPSALIIGPEDWEVSSLQFIQDYLAREGIVAKTFRPDDLSIDDVLETMRYTQGVILVTGAAPSAWGNRHRFRIQQAANELGIPLNILSQGNVMPINAADEALSLLR